MQKKIVVYVAKSKYILDSTAFLGGETKVNLKFKARKLKEKGSLESTYNFYG